MQEIDRKLAQRLARALQSEIDTHRAEPVRGQAARPVIPAQPGRMDDVTRQAHLRRIRLLRDRYGLRWLVDEASGYVQNLDELDDAELVAVQAALDRARQCIQEGIPLEDAGLAPAAWDAPGDFADHVSLRVVGDPKLPDHLSPPADPDFVFVPWYRRPENTF